MVMVSVTYGDGKSRFRRFRLEFRLYSISGRIASQLMDPFRYGFFSDTHFIIDHIVDLLSSVREIETAGNGVSSM